MPPVFDRRRLLVNPRDIDVSLQQTSASYTSTCLSFCSRQLPYDQAATGASATPSELHTLTYNADVKALRDTYAADLVVLVGSFSGTCGRGYDC